MVNQTLIPTVDSWFMGVNSNLPDKPRTFLAYAGGAPRYREKCEEVVANGYEGFAFDADLVRQRQA
jgi:cyclohexanone monooxygenase